MFSSAGLNWNPFFGFILIKVASIKVITYVPNIESSGSSGASSVLKCNCHHVRTLERIILIGANIRH